MPPPITTTSGGGGGEGEEEDDEEDGAAATAAAAFAASSPVPLHGLHVMRLTLLASSFVSLLDETELLNLYASLREGLLPVTPMPWQ